MIHENDTVYVTLGISRGPDGSIGILLPEYTKRKLLRDSQQSELHAALAAILREFEAAE